MAKQPIIKKHSAWIVAIHGKGKTRKYLMGKRAKGTNNPGQWGFFGGTVDVGELPENGGTREFYEETGNHVNIIKKLGNHVEGGKKNHYFLSRYAAPPDMSKIDKNETETHKWVSIKQAKRMNLHSSAKHYFETVRPKVVRAAKIMKTINKTTAAYNDDEDNSHMFMPYGYWIDEKGTMHPVSDMGHDKFLAEYFENPVNPIKSLGWIRLASSLNTLFIQFKANSIAPKAAQALIRFFRDHSFDNYSLDLEGNTPADYRAHKFASHQLGNLIRLINQNIRPNTVTSATEEAHWKEFNTPLLNTKNNGNYKVRKIKDEHGEHYNVYYGSHKIAHATLSREKTHVTDVSVNKEHRGNGIAKALYNHIESKLGYKLKHSPIYQTQDGKKLWSKITTASNHGDPESQMHINGVNYDQHKGLGNVPNNTNVNYLGFAVMMRPSQFKKLAEPRDFDHESSIKHITTAIKNGKAIGSPFLGVTFDRKYKKPAVVTSHEGRTRMEAIHRVHGDVPVMVHIFPNGGYRSRHISAAHIKAFQQAAVPQKKKAAKVGPHFEDTIYHQGEWKHINDLHHKAVAALTEENFTHAWVDPDGKIHPVRFEKHKQFAQKYIKDNNLQNSFKNYIDALPQAYAEKHKLSPKELAEHIKREKAYGADSSHVDYMVNKGWAKITHSNYGKSNELNTSYNKDNLSLKTANTLKRLAKDKNIDKHFVRNTGGDSYGSVDALLKGPTAEREYNALLTKHATNNLRKKKTTASTEHRLDKVPEYELGKAPIPAGRMRRFHVTHLDNIDNIKQHGLTMDHAKNIEGPKAICSWNSAKDAKNYGNHIVEFHDDPKHYEEHPYASRHNIAPENIIAIHHPWHKPYRMAKSDPKIGQRLIKSRNYRTNYEKAASHYEKEHKMKTESSTVRYLDLRKIEGKKAHDVYKDGNHIGSIHSKRHGQHWETRHNGSIIGHYASKDMALEGLYNHHKAIYGFGGYYCGNGGYNDHDSDDDMSGGNTNATPAGGMANSSAPAAIASNRNVQTEAGLLKWAKETYHAGRATHHDNAMENSAKHIQASQNHLSMVNADSQKHKDLLSHHTAVYDAHKQMRDSHVSKYNALQNKTPSAQKANWRDRISDRKQPTFGPSKPAEPTSTPTKPKVAPPNHISPKENGGRSNGFIPIMPPHPKGSSAYHANLEKQHRHFAKMTTTKEGLEHHQNMADLHKNMQQHKPDEPESKPQGDQPISHHPQGTRDYHNDHMLHHLRMKNIAHPDSPEHKHHHNEFIRHKDASAAAWKKENPEPAKPAEPAKQSKFKVKSPPPAQPAKQKSQTKYSIKPNPAAKPTSTPEPESVMTKADHMKGLRKHQALVNKHSKIIEGLKGAMRKHNVAPDVAKLQRAALKKHNGHLRDAKDKVKFHSKELKNLGVQKEKLAPKLPKENPKEAPVNTPKPKVEKTITPPKMGKLKTTSTQRRKRA